MSYTFTYIWGWRKVWKSGGDISNVLSLFAFLFYSCKIWRGHGPLWPHFSATPDLHTYTLQKTAPPFSNALTQYDEISVIPIQKFQVCTQNILGNYLTPKESIFFKKFCLPRSREHSTTKVMKHFTKKLPIYNRRGSCCCHCCSFSDGNQGKPFKS